MSNFFLSGTDPYNGVRATKQIEDWLEPKYTDPPDVDFDNYFCGGIELSNTFAKSDTRLYSWQKNLSLFRTTLSDGTLTPCICNNARAITACLRGYRPIANAFYSLSSTTSVTVTRNSDSISIGSVTKYASDFRNGSVPYVIIVAICGGGGGGACGDSTSSTSFGGGGGGGGAGALVVLDFSVANNFVVSVGARNSSSSITSGSTTINVGNGANKFGSVTQSGGSGGSVSGASGNGIILIDSVSGGSGGNGDSSGGESLISRSVASDSNFYAKGSGGSPGSGSYGSGNGGGGGASIFGNGGRGAARPNSASNCTNYGGGGGGGGYHRWNTEYGGYGYQGIAVFYY